MAHCQNCGCSKISCGCKDTYLTTPPPCPTPADCPDPQPCAEVFDAQCIVYTGPDLECGTDVVVSQNSSVSAALEDIITYFCTGSTATIISGDIFCQESPQVNTLVVPENTLVNVAIELVVEYFCDRFSSLNIWYTIEADTGSTSANTPTDILTIQGNGNEIKTEIIGDTLTINYAGVKKYTGNYNSAVGTTVITHNLNTLDVVMSIRQNGVPFGVYTQGAGQDYTYVITDANSVTITDNTGMAAITVTVIG